MMKLKSFFSFYTTLLLSVLILCISCKNNSTKKEKTQTSNESNFNIDYAETFTIKPIDEGYLVSITQPWPESDKVYSYVFYKNKTPELELYNVDYKIKIPLRSIVVTSTTHIPALDTLGVLDKLVGFPNTNYISTTNAVKRVKSKQIKEIGQNQNLNTELLLQLNPDVLVTFAVKGENKNVESIKKANIPVLYNADWVEKHPLGKAEWIKFFGILFNKEAKANAIFNHIKTEYEDAKKIASKAEKKPTCISGALWKDVWYAPGGESWQAQFLKDAHTDYIYADTKENGSLSLSLESVLTAAKNVDFWVAPAQFTSYSSMKNENSFYAEFLAFKNKNLFTFAKEKGENGGLIYYELASQRPDWVLKDLIHVFHPELLKDYETHFFKPLDP